MHIKHISEIFTALQTHSRRNIARARATVHHLRSHQMEFIFHFFTFQFHIFHFRFVHIRCQSKCDRNAAQRATWIWRHRWTTSSKFFTFSSNDAVGRFTHEPLIYQSNGHLVGPNGHRWNGDMVNAFRTILIFVVLCYFYRWTKAKALNIPIDRPSITNRLIFAALKWMPNKLNQEI